MRVHVCSQKGIRQMIRENTHGAPEYGVAVVTGGIILKHAPD